MGISELHHMGFLETFRQFQIMLLQEQLLALTKTPIQIYVSKVL